MIITEKHVQTKKKPLKQKFKKSKSKVNLLITEKSHYTRHFFQGQCSIYKSNCFYEKPFSPPNNHTLTFIYRKITILHLFL
jgi:hypothetical protein